MPIRSSTGKMKRELDLAKHTRVYESENHPGVGKMAGAGYEADGAGAMTQQRIPNHLKSSGPRKLLILVLPCGIGTYWFLNS